MSEEFLSRQTILYQHEIDLVLLDIVMPVMPEMDGQELINAIRAERKYDNIAILANTQFGEQAREEEILKDGADELIIVFIMHYKEE